MNTAELVGKIIGTLIVFSPYIYFGFKLRALPEATELTRMSIFWFMLKTILTFGAYALYWLILTTTVLNRSAQKKISLRFIYGVVVYSMITFLLQSIFIHPGFLESYKYLDQAISFSRFFEAFLYILWNFEIRRLLHEKGHELNGFLTLFFGLFYIVYKVNRLEDDQQEADPLLKRVS